MTNDDPTDIDDVDWDDVDDWPTRMGRTPIGPPIRLSISADAHRAMVAAAEPFGQRRRSAVLRVAIRRLLADHTDLAVLVRQRENNRATRSLYNRDTNIHLDEELTAQLTGLADTHGTSRAELVRIAIDRFLVDLSQLRLSGTPFDLETAVNDEIFNGDANRARLIRRRRQREAERLGDVGLPPTR